MVSNQLTSASESRLQQLETTCGACIVTAVDNYAAAQAKSIISRDEFGDLSMRVEEQGAAAIARNYEIRSSFQEAIRKYLPHGTLRSAHLNYNNPLLRYRSDYV